VGIWTSIYKKTKSYLNKTFTFLKSSFNRYKSFIKSIWTSVFNFYVGVWTKIYTETQSALNSVRKIVTQKLTQVKNTATSTFGSIKQSIGKTWTSIFTTTKATLTTIANWITSSGASLFASAFGVVRDSIYSIFNGIIADVTGVIEGLVDDIIDAVTSVADKVRNAFERINIDIPEPDIPDVSLPNRSLETGNDGDDDGDDPAFGDDDEWQRRAEEADPDDDVWTGFATGGLVTDATQALIGEGRENEAVLPLSKLSNYLDTAYQTGVSMGSPTTSGGAGGSTVRLRVEGDGALAELIRENAELVVEEHESTRADRLGRF
jgi:hypothetical protein